MPLNANQLVYYEDEWNNYVLARVVKIESGSVAFVSAPPSTTLFLLLSHLLKRLIVWWE